MGGATREEYDTWLAIASIYQGVAGIQALVHAPREAWAPTSAPQVQRFWDVVEDTKAMERVDHPQLVAVYAMLDIALTTAQHALDTLIEAGMWQPATALRAVDE